MDRLTLPIIDFSAGIHCSDGSGGKAGGSKAGSRASGGGAAATESEGANRVSSASLLSQIDENAYDPSLSTKTPFGAEKSYAGVDQYGGNSRIFGIQKELRFWKNHDTGTQADFFEEVLGHLQPVGNSSAFERRANGDALKLWKSTNPQAQKQVIEYAKRIERTNNVFIKYLQSL